MSSELNFLSSLPAVLNVQSRSISAENPTGAPGAGALEVPDPSNPASLLGKRWKVKPCIKLLANSVTTLADITGPGTVTHIWITVDPRAYRDCVLRFYWDGEPEPSIEVPVGDFFAEGHSIRYNVNSLPVAVNPSGGFNSYWPMPFRKSCKITVENQRWEDIDGFFYQISYSLGEVADTVAYFHATWRRTLTSRIEPEHILLDNVNGKGHYVGTFIAWSQLSNGWWGEGEVKFFIDSDKDNPSICGTGTEDYFGGAWGFGETFSTAFLGYPFWRKEPGEIPKHSLYRWHIMDPIRFQNGLRVTIQALGWWLNNKLQPLQDDVASIAYWYQTEPHTKFPQMPGLADRWAR